MTLWDWLHFPFLVIGGMLTDRYDGLGFLAFLVAYDPSFILCVRRDLHC